MHPTILPGEQARHLFNDCEPTAEFWTVCSAGLPCLPLKSDQPNMRPIDKLQILSWNTGPPRGSDRSLLASHLNGPWHVICVQEGSGFVTGQFPARELPRGHPALSRRAPQHGYPRVRHLLYTISNSLCIALRDHGLLKAWWSLENFARHPTIRAPSSLNYR